MSINRQAMITAEWKRGRVSGKRQITIPQKFFEQLQIKDEVEFSVQDNVIIIRPVREQTGSDQFADLILADLIHEGYAGDELLAKFREKQAQMPKAVQRIIADSKQAALDHKKDQTEELFGDVMED
ncbi:AbrB/MazE/SpoVT family DNA-binding domain-containing protein [Saccharibacillus sacchari]|uniref:AbrB/MazE/SpoVT family DNA-binding domain-containing protein n=1 Tax=Saccharibacillus sacchari TaxID=456493 RepID=A0ACC6PG65_9BACL